jgi:predicted transposase/invertase (TIGR01784 family)
VEFHNCYKIINTTTGKDDKLHDIFELHYVELRKFSKSPEQVSSALDRWSTFLTKAHKLDKNHVPQELAFDAAIVKAISAVDRMFDEEERMVYEVRMQSLAEVESKIASAEEKGLERGIEEGKHQASQAIALNLLAQGVDIPTIVKATGLEESMLQTIFNK